MLRTFIVSALLVGAALPAYAQDAPVGPVATKPAALTVEEVPPLPLAMVAQVRPYMESRGAGFAGWDPKARAVLIQTRFAFLAQLAFWQKYLLGE